MDFSNNEEDTRNNRFRGADTGNSNFPVNPGVTSFSNANLAPHGETIERNSSTSNGGIDNTSMSFPDFLGEDTKEVKQETKAKTKRSSIVWVTAILCLALVGVVTFGIKTFYDRRSFTSTASLNTPVDSFWERSAKAVFVQPETKIETGNAVLTNAQVDPQSSYVVTNKKVYKVEKGYLVAKGDLPAEYATRRLIEVFDSVAMFASQSNSVSPFLNLETMRPVNRPEGAKVIDPVGIYNRDLLVARIQKEINGKTLTVGFNLSGDILWKYDSYCHGELKKRPQLLMMEKCNTGEKQSKLFRRFLDVRNGNTKDVTLSENEYVKVADDHIYLVNVGNKSARYFDDDLTLVPAGEYDPTVLTGDSYRTNEYEISFQTFSLADRMEALKQVKRMVSENKNQEKTAKPKLYMATAGGKVIEINDQFKCRYPYFVSENKKYLCGVSYHGDVLEMNGYTVFDAANHTKILSSNVKGIPVRFNRGLALLRLAGEGNDTAQLYLLK